MSGRIVVITGATAGIGKATAELFKKNGDKVYCLARRTSDEFDSISVDVTDRAAVGNAIKEIIEKENRIDVLVNNAGFGISGAIENTDTETAKRLFDVNFFGVLNTVQSVLPYMRGQKNGTIINISSVAAPLSIPFQAFYSASKAAVSSFTEALRIEVAPYGVKVTSVLPGDVKTDFTAKREKNTGASVYDDRIARSVAVMERDEQNGYPPIVIAKAVYKLSKKKNPPVQVVGGKKYALFVMAAKLLPKRLINFAVGKLYG